MLEKTHSERIFEEVVFFDPNSPLNQLVHYQHLAVKNEDLMARLWNTFGQSIF